MTAPRFISATALDSTHVELLFTGAVEFEDDPGTFTLSSADPTAAIPTVTAVEADGPLLTITTTEHTQGKTYTVTCAPEVYSPDGEGLLLPCVQNYTGIGVAPFVVMVQPIDTRTLRVYFSEALTEADALTAANYTLTGAGGPEVLSVAKVTFHVYDLTTSPIEPSEAYDLTVTSIRDVALNPIA